MEYQFTIHSKQVDNISAFILFYQEDELRDKPMVVVCNKQDIAGAMTVPEITEHLQLYKINRTIGMYIETIHQVYQIFLRIRKEKIVFIC